MKRQKDWEELWQQQSTMSVGADRWAPWLALLAAVGLVIVGGL